MTMNFFNKAKETAAKVMNEEVNKPSLPKVSPKKPGGIPNKPGVHLPNKPLAKPGSKPLAKPLSKPAHKEEPKENISAQEETIKEEKKNISPLAKNNPFKKTDIAANKNVTSEDIVPVQEEKTIQAEPEKDEAKKEIQKEEVKKPAAKKATKKTTKKVTETETSEISTVSIPVTEVDFNTAIASIKSNFVDEEWDKLRKDLSERINAIVITSDMTSKLIKNTVSKLDNLRDEIRDVFISTKNQYDELTSKEPEGFIERIKRLSAKGSNAEDRKLNGILAVMNYQDPEGNKINLYEVLDEVRERYSFLKSIMDAITYKNNVLVTMLGSLKLEK